jgi:hypothetical protein
MPPLSARAGREEQSRTRIQQVFMARSPWRSSAIWRGTGGAVERIWDGDLTGEGEVL